MSKSSNYYPQAKATYTSRHWYKNSTNYSKTSVKNPFPHKNVGLTSANKTNFGYKSNLNSKKTKSTSWIRRKLGHLAFINLISNHHKPRSSKLTIPGRSSFRVLSPNLLISPMTMTLFYQGLGFMSFHKFRIGGEIPCFNIRTCIKAPKIICLTILSIVNMSLKRVCMLANCLLNRVISSLNILLILVCPKVWFINYRQASFTKLTS